MVSTEMPSSPDRLKSPIGVNTKDIQALLTYQSEYCLRFLKHQTDFGKEILQYFIPSILQVSYCKKPLPN